MNVPASIRTNGMPVSGSVGDDWRDVTSSAANTMAPAALIRTSSIDRERCFPGRGL
jgi:hypothetical protein